MVTFQNDENYSIRFEMKNHYSHSTIDYPQNKSLYRMQCVTKAYLSELLERRLQQQ